jgi:aspartate 1-decarboxylase
MNFQLLKSKIHRARVTQTIVDYEGSLGIDEEFLKATGLRPYERILVVNSTNGARLETYAIVSPAGSRTFCLNGAAARLGEPGDVLTIMNFAFYDEAEAAGHKPSIIVLDENNEILERK